MFGLGKKDKDGKQVRIEQRGKYTRASGTGGDALRAERKLGPVNATANTSDGFRLSSRVPVKGMLIDECRLYVTSQFLNHPSKRPKSVYNCL